MLIQGRQWTFGESNNNQILQTINLLYVGWRIGQMGGIAIRDAITGSAENSGRLAQNWPRKTGQIGSGSNPWLSEIRGKWVSNSVGIPDLDGRIYDSYVSNSNEKQNELR